jgi:hypothetical protein
VQCAAANQARVDCTLAPWTATASRVLSRGLDFAGEAPPALTAAEAYSLATHPPWTRPKMIHAIVLEQYAAASTGQHPLGDRPGAIAAGLQGQRIGSLGFERLIPPPSFYS